MLSLSHNQAQNKQLETIKLKANKRKDMAVGSN